MLKKLTVTLFAFCLALTATAADAPAKSEIKLAIIGDSTVCDYPESSVTRGWGQYIPGYFTEKVHVVNLAKSGRSTKTFIAEKLWDKTLKEKPDYILIQFGHNDSHGKGHPEATDAATDYKDYLRRYVEETRGIGAIPILVTPMHRRTFKPDGTLSHELQPYCDAMKEVATEKKVALVDLQTSSGELFQKLGDAGSADLSCKPEDRTHFSPKGAQAMAELVAKELRTVEPGLKSFWKN